MRSLIIGLAIALITFIADQWTKSYFFNLLDAAQAQYIEVLPFFNLVKVYNYGVSFGMFNDIENGKIILSAIAIIITIALCIWLHKVTKMYMIVALGLIIGGAVGNIYDRLKMGAVADFIDIYVGKYHWPAFNLADSTIFIGVAILFIDSFINKDEQPKKGKKDEENNS
jgi:signal peptidase II